MLCAYTLCTSLHVSFHNLQSENLIFRNTFESALRTGFIQFDVKRFRLYTWLCQKDTKEEVTKGNKGNGTSNGWTIYFWIHL